MKNQLLNKKIVLGVLSLVSVLLCTTISSFLPFTFKPENIFSSEFLTNELIICAIVIITMVSSIFIGQASNAQNPNSNIAKARVKFFETCSKIEDINKFFQWVKTVLQPSDIKAMNERRMREVGIEDYSVLELDIPDIESLENKSQKIDGKPYKGLSKKQIEVVKKIKLGEYKITLVDPTYYITVKNIDGNKTITEKASKEQAKKGIYLSYSIISKVIMTIFIGMIFASLAKDTIEGQDIATSIMTFGSRLFSMISCMYMGYVTGCQINDIDAEYIQMRSIVHSQFLQDKAFIPKTIKEIAQIEYEKEHIEEKEEEENGEEQSV